MSNVLDKIVATKWKEIEAAKSMRPLSELRSQIADARPPRDFLAALSGYSEMRLIAEVKKASPSKGVIRADFDPVQIASQYESAGAAAISVLTDESYFQGSLEYLSSIASSVNIPVMRKEFILDEHQIYEARAAGADAILLIAECLDRNRLNDLYQLAQELGMGVLIELYETENLEKVLSTGCKIVGVNNRDLRNFEVDLSHTIGLRSQIPTDVCLVAESGISTPADVSFLKQGGANAMLVGESLMRHEDVYLATKTLLGQG